VCTNGQTQACTVSGCAGTTTCSNNQWGSCIKNDVCCGITCSSGQTCQNGQCVSSGGGTCPSITNSGFESDTTGWTFGGQGDHKIGTTVYSGSKSAVIGFKDSSNIANGKDYVYQTITVPSGSSAVLSFYYRFYSYDYCDYDFFNMKIRDGSGNVKSTVISKCHNGWGLKDTGWTKKEVDLSSYAGQTIQIYFEVENRYDTLYNSWAFVDDVKVECYFVGDVELYSPVMADNQCPTLCKTAILGSDFMGITGPAKTITNYIISSIVPSISIPLPSDVIKKIPQCSNCPESMQIALETTTMAVHVCKGNSLCEGFMFYECTGNNVGSGWCDVGVAAGVLSLVVPVGGEIKAAGTAGANTIKFAVTSAGKAVMTGEVKMASAALLKKMSATLLANVAEKNAATFSVSGLKTHINSKLLSSTTITDETVITVLKGGGASTERGVVGEALAFNLLDNPSFTSIVEPAIKSKVMNVFGTTSGKAIPDLIFTSSGEAFVVEVKNYGTTPISKTVLEGFVAEAKNNAVTYSALKNAGQVTGPQNANKLLLIFENPGNPISQSVKNEIPKLATENDVHIMIVKLKDPAQTTLV